MPAMTTAVAHTAAIRHVQLIVGLEIHIELATATKMFSRVPNVAHRANFDAPANSLIDPVTLGLPGALPVLNKRAVEMSISLGLALGCSIATTTRWDRKSYFYPDMPKNYQISQYQLPLCFDGMVHIPASDASEPYPSFSIGIIRAHLEEDAGKLSHESHAASSLVNFNRAGTPLLEVVTQPDFTTATQVVAFAQWLHGVARYLRLTEGIMQRGHMRFEPNINCILTLQDGRFIKTPIAEIKNLNSFRSLRGAIEHELAEQPKRWQADGREMNPGSKTTRGWDDQNLSTFPQREKEEAADYRYFPDPDLLPVTIDRALVEHLRQSLPELPHTKAARLFTELGLPPADAETLVQNVADSELFDAALTRASELGVERVRAAKLAANFIVQSGAKRANELFVSRSKARDAELGEAASTTSPLPPVLVSDLGITGPALGDLVKLRDEGAINSNAADELFGALCEPQHRTADPRELATARGLLVVRDDAAIDTWCQAAIDQQPQAAADVKAGKDAALGRLVGAAMKVAGGAGDAPTIRARLLAILR